MIDAISIAGEATFDSTPQLMSGLSHFNYIFGPNASGKTTLSRIIANIAAYPTCQITWRNGTPLETVVYNRDFVTTNFHQCDELPGIFTLGEKDAEILRKIAEAQDQRDALIRTREQLEKTLVGHDGKGGKRSELATHEDSFRDVCWAQKRKYDGTFMPAFEGFRNNAENFKNKVLKESASNKAGLCTLADLEARATTVFGPAPTSAAAIPPLAPNSLLSYEKHPILTKRVIGKSDIDIAALILKLGNSDWVQAGRSFYSTTDRICPFCQQKAPSTLETSLNEYFDDAFARDSEAIKQLESNYRNESRILQDRLSQLLTSSHPFLDITRLKEEKELLDANVLLNLQHLARKKSEPSQGVTLVSLAAILASIDTIIAAANTKVAEHNATVANLAAEKVTLTADVWRYLLDVELKDNLDTYNKQKAGLTTAIASLEGKIADQRKLVDLKSAEIAELERETTSIQPTIDGINRLLKSFGFRGFELTKADNQRCYKLIRQDGSDAKETLSEGERTFVTFLYFYYLLKGSTSESGTATNRIVVFDDPVSSLDSDILFIVGSLIKGLFEEVRSGVGQIKQIFVLTHNVYFHKEVTFNTRRSDRAMAEETFWTIRKPDHKSTLLKHDSNPIKTSYELLWADVRDHSRVNVTIQNTLRRILENYFRILGGVDPDAICNKFEGHDRIICKSLFSWINDGSHSAHDELYLSIEDSAIERYLRVFREIFKRMDHFAHYKMMMGEICEDDDAASGTPEEQLEPVPPTVAS